MHVAHHVTAVVGATSRGTELHGAPMHQAHGQPGIGHRGVHLFIREAARDIIDEVYAGLGRGTGHGSAHGVDGGLDSLFVERTDHRNHALLLDVLLHTHRSRPGPGGFAADVDHVSARGDQLVSMRERGIDVDPAPAVRKRIFGDVHDSHDQGAAGDGQVTNCHC